MVLIDKRAALQEVENVPIICNVCKQRSELAAPTDTVRDKLVEASYIRYFQEEIARLHQAQALFDRFPNSRHPIRINHLYLDKAERSRVHADPEFSQALAADPELSEFLTNGSCWLPARLKAITEACQSWESRFDREPIRCAACAEGHYLIEQDFFDHLLCGRWDLAHHP